MLGLLIKPAFGCKLTRPIHMQSFCQRKALVNYRPRNISYTNDCFSYRRLWTITNESSSFRFHSSHFHRKTCQIFTENRQSVIVLFRPFSSPIEPTPEKKNIPPIEGTHPHIFRSQDSIHRATHESNSSLKSEDKSKAQKDSVTSVTNASSGKNDEKKVSVSPTSQDKEIAEKKKPLWDRIKAEIKHYYHGFKLLYLDTKIAVRLCFGVLFKGKSLTRRERRQLVRTVADLFRLLPFLVFIIVPFMEFLLPLYLKFFPFMLPSTFQEEQKELEKRRQLLKGKLEMAKFLQDTLNERVDMAKSADAPTVQQFSDFLKQVRESSGVASTQDILKFTRLFEDEFTLDSLDHATLKGICKLLELNSIGPAQLLRFQIRMQMKKLYVDDEIIRMEGVDKLPVWDLQLLCRERGMRALGVSEDRLRFQLSQWLELHLDKKIPVLLLLLSRTMYLPETLTTDEQIKEVISRLPNSVSKEAALKTTSSHEAGRVDNKTVYELVKEEEAILKEEAQAAKKAAEAEKKKTVEAQKKETLTDKAPILHDKSASLEGVDSQLQTDKAAALEPTARADADEVSTTSFQDPSWGNIYPDMQAEVTANDLAQIESAIESIEATRIALDEEELKDLKDNLAETTALKQQKLCSSTESPSSTEKEIHKVTGRLEKKVHKLITEMDNLVQELKDKQAILENKLKADQASEGINQGQILQKIEDNKEKTVSIEDLLQSLRRLEKAPDEARMRKILKVLDEDNDGKIEMPHVSQIVELLSNENVKMTGKEVKKVLDTIDKEAFVEDVQKRQRQTSSKIPPVNDKDPSDIKS